MRSPALLSAPDHPRACGENRTSKNSAGVSQGSPPRVRGKRFRRTPSLPASRITPARAGKTGAAEHCHQSCQDHPRACGENNGCRTLRGNREGSPPRVRGKPMIAAIRLSIIGITPARAGKTVKTVYNVLTGGDHPRACGENVLSQGIVNSPSGSPPRVRGKLHNPFAGFLGQGITPARAGKTNADFDLISMQRDHPRACGENSSALSRAYRT